MDRFKRFMTAIGAVPFSVAGRLMLLLRGGTSPSDRCQAQPPRRIPAGPPSATAGNRRSGRLVFKNDSDGSGVKRRTIPPSQAMTCRWKNAGPARRQRLQDFPAEGMPSC